MEPMETTTTSYNIITPTPVMDLAPTGSFYSPSPACVTSKLPLSTTVGLRVADVTHYFVVHASNAIRKPRNSTCSDSDIISLFLSIPALLAAVMWGKEM